MIYLHTVAQIILGGVFAVFGYFIYVYCSLCYKFRKFKGPPAYPFVGNCYTPEALVFLKYLARLRARYGKIYTFFNFTKAFLVICDPVIVRRILSDPKTFYKGTDYTEKFHVIFGEGLVTSNGEKHRKDRSTFGKYFIRSSVAKFAAKINELADRVIADYLPDSGKQAVNVEAIFARLALRAFMNFALSGDLSDNPREEEEICHAVSAGSGAVGRLIAFNEPLWSFMPDIKIIKKVEIILNRVMKRSLEDRKQKLAKGEAEDIDDCLAAMIRENMSEKEMFEHFTTLICAGHDTTAFFLSYMVYLLAQHPEVQQKLYEDIVAKVGNRNEITADDFAEMKYLHCVMMETLRLYAIIPGITRTVNEEFHFKEANITIPAGTNVLIPMVVINRDPEVWDNPSEFRPARFEEKGNDFTSAKDGFFPFGYGTRTCIGNTFAQIEACIVLCKLMKKFIIEPDPKFKISIRSGISLTTFNGINASFKPRPAMK